MRDRARVIVNADDLGLRRDWDAVILRALDEGLATGTSILVTGSTRADAVCALRAAGLAGDVGVHLDLVSGAPVSPCADVRSLTGMTSRFPGSWAHVLAGLARGSIRLDEVELEWSRQIGRALDDGLGVSHLDSHYHLHLVPALHRIVRRLADTFGVPHVRMLGERPRLGRPRTLGLWLAARLASREGDPHAVRSVGAAASGALDEQAWSHVIADLRPGATEIVCHPGQSDAEDRALRSRAVRDALHRAADLARFADLEVERAGAPRFRAAS